MGFLKNLFFGAVAAKTYNAATNRPTVVAPPDCSILNLEPIGVGTQWRVTWAENKSLNNKRSFKINRATRGMTSGRHKFIINWPK
jgi:hypothetical protein